MDSFNLAANAALSGGFGQQRFEDYYRSLPEEVRYAIDQQLGAFSSVEAMRAFVDALNRRK